MRTGRTVETEINHSLMYRISLALPLPNLGRPHSKHTAISNISSRLETAMENREVVQKPHEPHASFVRCAKPHDKPKDL
jgi:hypothetical protein